MDSENSGAGNAAQNQVPYLIEGFSGPQVIDFTKKFLRFRPKVHESSDPVQLIGYPFFSKTLELPGIHCASGLPLSKDLLRKPLHNLARLWSFEAPKKICFEQMFNYSTTATGIAPTLSAPRMCQTMQACQVQGHRSTGGLDSINQCIHHLSENSQKQLLVGGFNPSEK